MSKLENTRVYTKWSNIRKSLFLKKLHMYIEEKERTIEVMIQNKILLFCGFVIRVYI